MSSYNTRKEAIELSIRSGMIGRDVIILAREIHDYLEGTSDSEIIAAARVLSEKINARGKL